MQSFFFSIIAFFALSTVAFADDQLDKFEVISERSNAMLFEMMIDQAVKEGADRATLEAALPEFKWNEAMREAGTCMLQRYRDELGNAGVNAMIADLSAFMDEAEGMTMEEFSEAGESFSPEGITQETSMEITQACGMIEAQMAWMSETGFMDAFYASSQ